MNRLLLLTLSASMLVAGCATSASDDKAVVDSKASDSRGITGLWASRKAAVARTVTIPSGTALHLTLNTAVASDTSRLEDVVTAELSSPVVVDGRAVLPAGATVAGVVSGVDDSGRVKGRAHVALDFTSVTSGGSRYQMSAAPFYRRAPATKSEDATKIGIGAGAGAIIGGLLGGKKGAAEGAAVGGGAGTGVVLATKGEEVRLASGANVSTQLSAPLTVRLN